VAVFPRERDPHVLGVSPKARLLAFDHGAAAKAEATAKHGRLSVRPLALRHFLIDDFVKLGREVLIGAQAVAEDLQQAVASRQPSDDAALNRREIAHD
jgi:hypothetical protein